MTAIEFVPLKKIEDGVEVLLTPRAQDDPFWPGMLHTPGTILRPTDRTFEDAFNRLFSNELPELAKIKPQFIGTHYGRGSRGSGVTFEYILDVTHDTRSDYKYYPVAELPNNFIPEQRGLVERAVEKLTQNN